MRFSRRAVYFLVTSFLFFATTTNAQLKKDTIYFDDDWSICEKPVAVYYRVAALTVSTTLFYTDSVSDYYLDNKILMKGFYDEKGNKNGHFTFFDREGNLLKEGNFKNDEMKGLWSFYNNGKLNVQLNCNSATDFIPVLIINSDGDTLLKDGTGDFVFNTKKDMPGIFPVSANYTLKGQLVNGEKDGEFYYWLGDRSDIKSYFYSETFKNGVFKRSRDDHGVSYNKRSTLLNLFAENHLSNTDNFYHGNMVFGYGKEGEEKVINFLVNGTEPELKIKAKSYEDDSRCFYEIAGTVIRKSILPGRFESVSYSNQDKGNKANILSFSRRGNLGVNPPDLHFTATLTIDTGGYFSNSVFRGNLGATEIGKINYYLSRISGLVPLRKNGQPVSSDINMGLATIIDTIRDENRISAFDYRYIAYNADTISPSFFGAGYSENVALTVDAPPAFIGGDQQMRHYLERHLNAGIAAEHKAPNGNYTVGVSFIVDAGGLVRNVVATDNPGYGMGEEAVRVIKSFPFWKPAIRNGKPVAYPQKQYITFQVR